MSETAGPARATQARSGFAATAVTIQAALVRVGMFFAAVLSTRPETMWLGDHFIFHFAIPFAAAALVVSILVGSRLALVVGLMTSFLAGLVSPFGMITAGYAVAGSIAAAYTAYGAIARAMRSARASHCHRRRQRSYGALGAAVYRL
jgi:hypothetical protein